MVARIFFEDWVVNYGIQLELLTDHGPQLMSRFSVAVYCTLVVKNITTAE